MRYHHFESKHLRQSSDMYGLSTRECFVTAYRNQVRKSLQTLNLAKLTVEGIRIWENMMPAEKKRFRKRLEAINAQPRKTRLQLRHAIETYFVSDKELKADAIQSVMQSVNRVRTDLDQPIFFLDATISDRTGYPAELTITKYSVSHGVEDVFHAQFSCKAATKQEFGRTAVVIRSELHLVPLRTIGEDCQNMRHVYDAIREFSNCQPLFVPRIKHRACLTAMLMINLADTIAGTVAFEVLQAETLVEGLIYSSIGELNETPRCLSFSDREAPKFLACDFHQECREWCTMSCSLSTAYTCGKLVAPVLGAQCEEGRHVMKEGFRPKCTMLKAAD